MGKIRDKEYDIALELYNNGISTIELSRMRGVSAAAINHALKRRGCQFRPKPGKGESSNFFRGTPKDKSKKGIVGHILGAALLRGEIIKPDKCDECGQPDPTYKNGRSGIEGHHCDYDKPLDVMWLCRRCHYNWHTNHKAKNEI